MNKVYKQSFFSSLGAGVYIVLVGLFINNAQSWFGSQNSLAGIMAFLILFSLSALVVGGLLVGQPLMLYLDGEKKDAVLMLAVEAGWLLLFFLLALAVLALR